MKTQEINLQKMNLVPLTEEEMLNENGGGLIDYVVAWVVEQVLDYVKDNRAQIKSGWQQGVKANYQAGTGSWTPVGAGF